MIFQSMYNPIRAQAVPESVQHPDGSVQLPPVEYPQPGFFDGMGDTWKSLYHGAYTGASSLITAASKIPLENLTTQPEVSDWVRRQREEVMPANAKELRRIAKDEYELDPRTSGMAAQIVFGLGDVLPKAALYGTAGPSAGSLLLGADLGIQRANELMDEGVDEKTAATAGVLSFAAGAIGMRLPAAFQTPTRLRSSLIGAGANAGLSATEVMGIHWVLEDQDYEALAQKYELSAADAVVSGDLGGAFGATFWSPIRGVRFQQQRKALSDRFASEIEKTKKFTPEQVTAQANLNAAVVTSAAARWGLTPEQVSRVAPRVRVDSATTADGFDMPVTQGIEWPMGPSKTIKPDDTLTVIRVTNAPVSRKEAVAQAADVFSRGVTNKSTGFVLTASRSDMKKAAGGIGSLKERVFTAVARDIARIAEESILVESHVDVQHRNPKVQGVHHFIAPVEFGGKLWRVQLLVRDIVEPKNDRAIVHSVDGIDIQEMETPPGGISQSESGASYVNGVAAADNRLVRLDTDSVPTDRTLSLTDLIGGAFLMSAQMVEVCLTR